MWDFDTKWGQRKVVDLKWKLKEIKVAQIVHTKTTNELEQARTSWNKLEPSRTGWNEMQLKKISIRKS